jgi:hypothetical protein
MSVIISNQKIWLYIHNYFTKVTSYEITESCYWFSRERGFFVVSFVISSEKYHIELSGFLWLCSKKLFHKVCLQLTCHIQSFFHILCICSIVMIIYMTMNIYVEHLSGTLFKVPGTLQRGFVHVILFNLPNDLMR